MLMISHLDGLSLRPIFFNSVKHLRMSVKTDSAGPPNVASSKYHMSISVDSDDATSSIAMAKIMGPKESPCWMSVVEQIGWPDIRTVEWEL